MDFKNIQLLKDNSFNELNNVQFCQRQHLGLSQYTIAQGQLQWAQQQWQCQRTTPMDFNQLLPKTTLLDLEKLAQLTMICCSQLEDRQSLLWFCSQCGGKNGSKFLPFFPDSTGYLKDFLCNLVECLMMSYLCCGMLYCGWWCHVLNLA